MQRADQPLAARLARRQWRSFCPYGDYVTRTDAMTDERRFGELLLEFQRVGVDPHSFPAGITVRSDAALRILKSLPDDAGPAAFLARIREVRSTPPGSYTLDSVIRADSSEL